MKTLFLSLLFASAALAQLSPISVPNAARLTTTTPTPGRPVLVEGGLVQGDGRGTGGWYIVTNISGTNIFVPAWIAETGGFLTGASSLAQLQDTNWFPIARRTGHAGMVGSVTNVGLYYSLIGDLVTWTPFSDALFYGVKSVGFSVYSPVITSSYVYNAATGPEGYTYSHDSGAAYFDGQFYAFWNATTNVLLEAAPGQINVLSTSSNFSTWSASIAPFSSSTYSTNPVAFTTNDVQWQPNPLAIRTASGGTNLLVIWCQQNDPYTTTYPANFVAYASRLTSSSAKWANVTLPLTLTVGTNTYWPFPTQNPLQLDSGRILAPVIWTSTNTWSSLPSGVSSNGFVAAYKLAGVVYSDDYGVTWNNGGYATQTDQPWTPWEFTITKQKNGGIRGWCRSLWTTNPNGLMLTANIYGDGISISSFEEANYEVPSSRLGTFQDSSGMEYWLMNDQPQQPNGYLGRANIAVWTSRTGGDDYAPGVGVSGEVTPAQYPQGFAYNGDLYGVYTSGDPYSISAVKVSPAPNSNTNWIYLRSNDKKNTGTVYYSGPPEVFEYPDGIPRIQAITNSASWSTNILSLGAWVASTNINHQVAAIFDNRVVGTVGDPKGLLVALVYPRIVPTPTAAMIRVALYTSTNASQNFDITGFVLPTNSWYYVGVSLSETNITGWIVNSSGTVQSNNVAVSPYLAINSTIGGIVGGSILGSAVESLNGYLRSCRVYPGVALSAANHRYLYALDNSALGASVWAGTATDPGAATLDLSAADYPGSNTSGWLAEWSPIGIAYRGNAEAVTYDSRSSVKLSGTGSASLDLPPSNLIDGYVLQVGTAFNVPYAPTNTLKLATVGSRLSPVFVQVNINRPGVVEIYDQFTGATFPIADLITNQWNTLTLQVGRGTVSASVNGYGSVAVPARDSNAKVFLGQGYLDVANTDPNQTVYFDVGETKAFVAKDKSNLRNPPGAPYQSTNILVGSFPRITLWETDVLGEREDLSFGIGVQSDSIRFGMGDLIGTNLLANFTRSGAFEFRSRAQTYMIMSTYLTNVTSGPLYLFQRGSGTLESPLPVTDGMTLGGIRAYGLTNDTQAAGASGGLTYSALGDFGPSNAGAKFTGSLTRTNETIAEEIFDIRNDSAEFRFENITVRGLNPTLTTSGNAGTNNTIGITINVTGGLSDLVTAALLQQNGTNLVELYTAGVLRLMANQIIGGNLTVSNSVARIGFRSSNGSSGAGIYVTGRTGRLIGVFGEEDGSGGELIRFQTNSMQFSPTTGPGLFSGTASPEGAQTAGPSSIYMRNNAGAGEIWIKTSGTGNTGWTQLVIP